MPRDRTENRQTQATPRQTRSKARARATLDKENVNIKQVETKKEGETAKKKTEGLQLREALVPIDAPEPSNAPSTKKEVKTKQQKGKSLQLKEAPQPQPPINASVPSKAPETTQNGAKTQVGSKRNENFLNIPQNDHARSFNTQGPKSPTDEFSVSMEWMPCSICRKWTKDGLVIFDCHAICCTRCLMKVDNETVCPRCDHEEEVCEPISREALKKLVEKYKKKKLKVKRRVFQGYIIPFRAAEKMWEFDISLTTDEGRRETREFIESLFDESYAPVDALKKIFTQFLTRQLWTKYILYKRATYKFSESNLYDVITACVMERFGDLDLKSYEDIASDAFSSLKNIGPKAGPSDSNPENPEGAE